MTCIYDCLSQVLCPLTDFTPTNEPQTNAAVTL